MKTHREWVAEALKLEKLARWSEASHAWAQARLVVERGPGPGPRGLEPGAVLRHKRRGEVRAECIYEAEGRFVYAGRVFPSLHKAAAAAGADLGLRGKYDCWIFWGVERQEQSVYARQGGGQ